MTTTKNSKGLRGLGMATLIGVASVLAAPSARALDDDEGLTCWSDPGNLGGTMFCEIGVGGGNAHFMGAFASDNGGNGGWVEFYEDDDGPWWVEHHADGGVVVGWDDDGAPGANNIHGPKLNLNQEGTFQGKPRPGWSGPLTTGPSRSYAAAKAAALVKTGTITGLSAPTITTQSRATSAQVTPTGTGKCMAAFVVKKNGAFVSSTGIVPITMGVPRTLALPNDLGSYTVELQGKDGCLGQLRTATISVRPRLFIMM